MTDSTTTPVAATAESTTPKSSKLDLSVDELLGEFAVAPAAATKSAAQVEREDRTDKLVRIFGYTANAIADMARGTEDEQALKGALVSLATTKARALKALAGVADAELDVQLAQTEADANADTPAVLAD